MAKKFEYRGKMEEYVNGIPAKDLDDEEYAELTTEQKNVVRHQKCSDGELMYKDVSSDRPSSSSRQEEKKGD